jgi:ABC-2 type transport system ATP-binding protein
VSWGVEDLTVRFGDAVALDGVTLEVLQGRVTGIVGGDGAGKTTLLRALVGAVRASAGEIRCPERRRIGYLAATSGTYPDLTVQENLAFAATAYGVAATDVRRRVGPYLERTGLEESRDRLVGRLSGGMRQKLGVIRAMVHRPDLLVLDEPTTGVDPVSRADLWWLIARSAAEGAAVVLATTYLDEAERASSLLALDRGRTLASGTADEIAARTPGRIVATTSPPVGEDARRSWRRGAAWRVWRPPGTPVEGEAIRADLQDAVTVAALERELAAAGTTPPVGEAPC